MKSLGLTVAALTCLIDVAAAQSAPSEPPSPEVLSKLIPKVASAQANTLASSSGGGISTEIIGNVATGWNYFHATSCNWYYDGTNNYTYVWPQEGGYWYVYNNEYATDTFDAACVNGNWVAVYVTNSSTGAFDQIYTYDYK